MPKRSLRWLMVLLPRLHAAGPFTALCVANTGFIVGKTARQKQITLDSPLSFGDLFHVIVYEHLLGVMLPETAALLTSRYGNELRKVGRQYETQVGQFNSPMHVIAIADDRWVKVPYKDEWCDLQTGQEQECPGPTIKGVSLNLAVLAFSFMHDHWNPRSDDADTTERAAAARPGHAGDSAAPARKRSPRPPAGNG